MRSLQQQKGVTTIGWLIILALIGFFVLLTLRMAPEYMEYYKVVSTLDTMEKESGFSTPQEIRRMAENRFEISYVTVITNKGSEDKAFRTKLPGKGCLRVTCTPVWKRVCRDGF